jgi:hypothetical protein
MVVKLAGVFGRAQCEEDRDEKQNKLLDGQDESHAKIVLEDAVPIIHKDQCIFGLADR